MLKAFALGLVALLLCACEPPILYDGHGYPIGGFAMGLPPDQPVSVFIREPVVIAPYCAHAHGLLSNDAKGCVVASPSWCVKVFAHGLDKSRTEDLNRWMNQACNEAGPDLKQTVMI